MSKKSSVRVFIGQSCFNIVAAAAGAVLIVFARVPWWAVVFPVLALTTAVDLYLSGDWRHWCHRFTLLRGLWRNSN
jgi:hypothetical protein